MRPTSLLPVLLAVSCTPAAPPASPVRRAPPRAAVARRSPPARRLAPVIPPRWSAAERQRLYRAMWKHTRAFRAAMMVRKDRRAGIVQAQKVLALVERAQGRYGQGLIPWLKVMAGIYAQLNRVKQGDACLRRVLAIQHHRHGARSSQVAVALNDLGIYHYRRSQYSVALSWLAKALALNQQLHGPMHTEVASVLNNQAAIHVELGHFGTALRLMRRVTAIEQKAYGANDIRIATGLHNLAMTYEKLAQYSRARALYRRALAIEERHYGKDHVEVASTLESLGDLLRELGDPMKARPLLERAERIKEKKLGPRHASTGRALLKLGRLWYDQGSYAKAERLFRRVLAIDTAVYGANHPEVAVDLTYLAALADHRGHYERGERLHLRSLHIFLKRFGRNHPHTVNAMHNLASHYQQRGDFERALRYHQMALPVLRKIYGVHHPRYATALSNLGGMYRLAGQLRKARRLMEQALRIREKRLGRDHLDVADTLGSLSIVLDELGEAKRALAYGKRALAIVEKRRGPKHDEVGRMLNSLAGSVEFSGDVATAERMYRRALAIRRVTRGGNHPRTADIYVNLGALLLRRGRFAEGWKNLHRALQLRLHEAKRLLPVMSERARGMYLLRFQGEYKMLVKAALDVQKRVPLAPRQAFGVALRYKGLLLDSLRQQRARAASARDPGVRKLLEQRDAALRWLNRISMQRPERLGDERHKELVAKAKELFEITEERLGRALQALGTSAAGRRVRRRARHRRARRPRIRSTDSRLRAVVRSLRRTDALVEYVVYRRYDYHAHRYNQRWRENRYAAFVVRPGGRGRVTLVDLGTEKHVDALARAQLRAVRRSAAVARSRGLEFALKFVERPARTLYDQVVAPLQAALRGARRVWVSPDGALGLVPLHALPDAQGRRWGERVRLALLDSGRDLPRTVHPPRIPGRLGPPVALVAPAYGAVARGHETFRSLAWSDARSGRLRGMLRAVQRRSRAVRRGARPIVLRGDRATEARLRQVKRPLVLHLYTHGFYLPPPTKPAAAGAAVIYLGDGTFLTRANPMRQSGVALAKANQGYARTAGEELLAKVRTDVFDGDRTLSGRTGSGTLRTRSVDASGDDGILTAEEAGLLDLRGTRLVVLGACQTGVGETRIGQGVYGLRRALLYAGAQSLLVSLWKVPEAPTRELLFRFYEALGRGQSRLEALRVARAAVRKKHPLPVNWAGFVLVGDPGRIR